MSSAAERRSVDLREGMLNKYCARRRR